MELTFGHYFGARVVQIVVFTSTVIYLLAAHNVNISCKYKDDLMFAGRGVPSYHPWYAAIALCLIVLVLRSLMLFSYTNTIYMQIVRGIHTFLWIEEAIVLSLPVFLIATSLGVKEIWIIIFLEILLLPIGVFKFIMETTGRCYLMLGIISIWLFMIIVIYSHISTGTDGVVALGVIVPVLIGLNVLAFYSAAIWSIAPPRTSVVLGTLIINDLIVFVTISAAPNALDCK